MIVNGEHIDNYTCPRCRYRHPFVISCAEADAIEKHARRDMLTAEHVDAESIDEIYDEAAKDVIAEVYRARVELGFAPMHSAHEGFAVLMEEVDELKAHVWMNQKKRDLAAMRKEAIQVAAMAIAFAAEVCSEERGRR